jgi:hypothetical protein
MENKNNGGEETKEYEEPEELSEEYDRYAAMAEIFTNKDFINFLNVCIHRIVDAIDKRTSTIENKSEEQKQEYYKINRLFLWQRFILSFMAIIVLGASAAFKWLPVDAIIPLMGGVIGSLFITPKNE